MRTATINTLLVTGAKCKYSLKCKMFCMWKPFVIMTCVQITRSCAVSNVLREDSSADLLVEFHQHAAGLHVVDCRITRVPTSIVVRVHVENALGAMTMPPAAHPSAVGRWNVVVDVWSTEHHPVSIPLWSSWRHHGITGVSAVLSHRQPVLTNFITDGERRVFSRVPQTSITLDLLTDTRH